MDVVPFGSALLATCDGEVEHRTQDLNFLREALRTGVAGDLRRHVDCMTRWLNRRAALGLGSGLRRWNHLYPLKLEDVPAAF